MDTSPLTRLTPLSEVLRAIEGGRYRVCSRQLELWPCNIRSPAGILKAMESPRTLATSRAVMNPGAEQLAKLIRQTAAGAPEGIAGLYRLYSVQLLRLGWRLTGSRHDAEDILHDLFLGLPEAIRSFEHRGSFAGWLSRVATRMALMRMRGARRRREATLEESQPAVPESLSAEDLSDLDQHIAALPATLRAVLVLRQIEGYSHDEVAALLGISSGASRVRFNRAVRRLRQRMTEKP